MTENNNTIVWVEQVQYKPIIFRPSSATPRDVTGLRVSQVKLTDGSYDGTTRFNIGLSTDDGEIILNYEGKMVAIPFPTILRDVIEQINKSTKGETDG